MKYRKKTHHSGITVNPFVSEAQRRACHAAKDPNWDCEEWEEHTPQGKLPARRRKRIKAGKRKLAVNANRPRSKSPPKPARAPNPLKADPTRTATLRRAFCTRLKKKFALLKGRIVRKLVDEDALGLVSNSSEPDPELERDTRLLDVAEEAYGRKDSPDYGQVFFNSSEGHVWYVTADGDEESFARWVQEQLEKVPLVHKVMVEAEGFPPRDGEWVQVYPKRREWVANCQPGQIRDETGKCGPGVGIDIPRSEMPQVRKEQVDAFLDWAKGRGVRVSQSSVPADSLSPTQSRFKQERVDSLPEDSLDQPVLTSSDDYILDGTHRWVRAWQKGPSTPVPILRVDKPLREALEFLRAFPGVQYAANAFCATGPGGGIDPSCPPGGGSSGRREAGSESGADPSSQEKGGDTGERHSDAELDRAGVPRSLFGKIRNAITSVRDAVHRVAVRINVAGLAPDILDTIEDTQRIYYAGGKSQAQPLAQFGIPLSAGQLTFIGSHVLAFAFRGARAGIKAVRSKLAGNRAEGQPVSDDDLTDIVYAAMVALHKAVPEMGHAPSRTWVKYHVQGRLRGKNHMTGDLPARTDGATTNLLGNARDWEDLYDSEKLKEFQDWLREQVGEVLTSDDEEELWRAYVQQGFAKGAGRAFDDTKQSEAVQAAMAEKGDFFQGTRAQFLKDTFGQPVSVDKVKLLASRTFDEMENVTDDMANRMSRTLTDGLVQGKSPYDIADDLEGDVDFSEARAETVARTEIVRAHAEGQLTALENLGVEEVGVAVEWLSTGDDRVCDLCEPLEGVVLTIDEARGLLPRHPNCFIDPDTPVAIDVGWKSLKSVVVGDQVLTHKGRLREVTQVHRNQSRLGEEVVELVTQDEKDWYNLEVTVGHPVYSRGEWKAAGDLKPGDVITVFYLKWPGKPDFYMDVRVKEVRRKKVYGDTLYNLSVEEDESYLVKFYRGQGTAWGQGAYIVHNCRCAFIPANVGEDDEDQKRSEEEVKDALNESGVEDVDLREDRPKSVLNYRRVYPWPVVNRGGKGNDLVVNDWSDAARAAALLARQHSREAKSASAPSGGWKHPDDPQTVRIYASHRATEKALEASDKAGHGGDAGAHLTAAQAHEDAANHHALAREGYRTTKSSHYAEVAPEAQLAHGRAETQHNNAAKGHKKAAMELLSFNAFCPTGAGGGQDNSCSPGSGGQGSAVLPYSISKDRPWLQGGEKKEYNTLFKRQQELYKRIKGGTATDDDKKESEETKARLNELSRVAQERRKESEGKGGAGDKTGGKTQDETKHDVKGVEEKEAGEQSTGGLKPGDMLGLDGLRHRLKDVPEERRPREIAAILDQIAIPVGSVVTHGMSKGEDMKQASIGDKEFRWPSDWSNTRMGDYIHEITKEDFPRPLWEATTGSITFTDQRNQQDAYWAKTYGMPGFTSSATGGDGSICVYNGARMSRDTFAHESGHNLARKLWNSMSPPADSPYGQAQQKEDPVTKYGSVSPAEDFAEACKLYSRTKGSSNTGFENASPRFEPMSPRKILQLRAPMKFAAIEQLMGG